MSESTEPGPNDPWADLPTPEQAALTPPPLPTMDLPAFSSDPAPEPEPPTPQPAASETVSVPPMPVVPSAPEVASQDTVSIEPDRWARAEAPPTVFTGPPTGLADPTVAVPPIVPAPEFAPEPAPPTPEPDEVASTEPEPPLVDRTERDTMAVVWAVLGFLVWVGVAGAAWWALTRTPDPAVSADDLPSPRTTLDTFSDMLGEDVFWDHILNTAGRLLAALGIGGALGLLLGRVVGSMRRVGRLLQPVPAFFRIVAPVLILPFLFVWWEDVRPFVAPAIAVFAVVSFTTASAFAAANKGWTTALAPRLVEGVRASVPVAWATLLVAELLETLGVGAALWAAGRGGRVDEMIIWAFVALALTVLVDIVLRLAQHLLRPDRRDDVPPALR